MPPINTHTHAHVPSTSPPSDSSSPSDSSPTSTPNLLVIHISVARVLASGRSYPGPPPLGPLAPPPYITHTIIDPSPSLPLNPTSGTVFVTLDGKLKQVKLQATCKAGRDWVDMAESFQVGSKLATRLGVIVKGEINPDDDYDDDDEVVVRAVRRVSGLGHRTTRGHVRFSAPPPPAPATEKKRPGRKRKCASTTTPVPTHSSFTPASSSSPDPLPTKRLRVTAKATAKAAPKSKAPKELRRSSCAQTIIDPTNLAGLILPDLAPAEVASRLASTALKNAALRRGLAVKSVLPHDHQPLTPSKLPNTGLKTAEFAARLTGLLKILHGAMDALSASNLAQLEVYFDVDWLLEDMESAIRGSISRYRLLHRDARAPGGMLALPQVEDMPSARKNKAITGFAKRLTGLVGALYSAVEVLDDLSEIEGLFDVDWMVEDLGCAVKGAISCKRLNFGLKGGRSC